jgi:hypothetical protein
MPNQNTPDVSRRGFINSTLTGAAGVVGFSLLNKDQVFAQSEQAGVVAEIAKQHDATLQALREWIAFPSIAAENRGYPEGPDTWRSSRAKRASRRWTSFPRRASRRLRDPRRRRRHDARLYFMYDVKQYDPAEWSSPPLEGRIVDRPGLGKVMVGRGATNTKGPQTALLAALKAFKAAGRKLPVNLVLVAEGEEEIGSPNFPQIVFKPEVEAALRKCVGIIIPLGGQDADGGVAGEPRRQGHRRARAGVFRREVGPRPGEGRPLELRRADRQPRLAAGAGAQHSGEGRRPHHPAVEGFFDKVEAAQPELRRSSPTPSRAAQRGEGEEAPSARSAGSRRAVGGFARAPGVAADDQHRRSRGRLHRSWRQDHPAESRDREDRHAPRARHEGAGPTLELVKAHLAKQGFGDLEVNMTGGYDPTQTAADSKLVKAMLATYRRPDSTPCCGRASRARGPGVTFTGAPLNLPAGRSALGSAGAPTRRTSSGSSSPPTRRSRGWTAQ